MAGRSNTTLDRKRLRSQNEEEPSSTASKRRRLKPSDDSPAIAAAPDPEPSTTNKTPGRGRRKAAASTANNANVDSRKAPDLEAEGGKRMVQPNHDKTKAKKPQIPASRQRASVYDVPDSGEDELGATAVAPRPTRQRQAHAATAKVGANGVNGASLTNGDESAKRKRGRPRKQDREAMVEVPIQPENEESKDVGSTISTSIPQTRRPRRAPNGKLPEDAQVPKGILTPRKGGGAAGRRRKSVAFDRRPDEDALDDVGAETPSRSARKRREAASSPTEDEMEVDASNENQEPGSDEEEDDEVCAICFKPDSETGNEIVFCDSCDMAVHQECYGLPEIPKEDWICRNCLQDNTNPVSHPRTKEAKPRVAAQGDQKPNIPNFDEHLRSMKRVLLDRCTGRRRIKLRGQDEAHEKAYQLVEQTIIAGEGNSMLVIGTRGCGKTTLVESIISVASERHKDQFHVVRLNGFIHTDDKLALREIWRQLGKEMEIEDELVNKTSNYADTMASLLALLSHPSEIAEGQDGITSKSIVFVMDEFDLFATHPRQTLLYNLFDIAQARKAPIAVLGLTTRIDVVESLEKRVKSRFSHRYVYLSLPKSLPAYWDVCKQGLTIDDEDMVAEGVDKKLEGHQAFWDWWNGKVEALHKTQGFMDHLESHFYSTKSVSAFLTTCILPLAALSPTSLSLQIATSSVAGISLEAPDSKLHLLGSLSDLDLSMLIAAARLDIVAHTDTVNFAMAYDEYTSLMGRQRVQSASSGMLALGGGARVWGRGPAGMAWERLVALGLLVPAAAGGRGTAGLGGLDAKMWKVDVALEEIPAAVKLSAVLARWCREI
ncbi:origin recognition complex subunit 4 [Madurella fahalii]|uniref:Origin recognition complex subunit 4 n=1 Tax=Madurella fahalii TaxID=1157608 RepID=A0ABQ0GMH1_9PEZI